MGLGPAVYKLIFDTKSAETLVPTRRELSLVKKVIEETASPMERYASQEAVLNRLHEKGALTLEQKAKALAKVRKEAEEAAKPEKVKKEGDSLEERIRRSSFGGMIPVFDPITLSLNVLAGAFGKVEQAAGAFFSFLGSRIGKAFGDIQELGNTAQSLGIAVDKLQAMKFAAGQADVEFEKLQVGLARMEELIAKAASGDETFLGRLKLDAEKLRKLDPVEQFKEISDVIRKMPNPGDRILAAREVFGKGGIELLRFIESGRDGIEEATKALERMGIKITALDVANIGAVDSELKTMRATVDGIFMKLDSALAPTVKVLLADMNAFFQTSSAGDKISESIDRINIGFTILVDNILPAVKKELEGLTGPLDTLWAGMPKWFTQPFEDAPGWLKIIEQTNDLNPDSLINRVRKDQKKLADELKERKKALEEADSGEDAFGMSGKTGQAFKKKLDQEQKLRDDQFKIQLKVADAARKREEDAQKKIGQFHMTDRQKVIDDAKRSGASDAEIKRIKIQQETLKVLDQEKSRRDAVRESIEKAAKAQEHANDVTRASIDITRRGSHEAFELLVSGRRSRPEFSRGGGMALDALGVKFGGFGPDFGKRPFAGQHPVETTDERFKQLSGAVEGSSDDVVVFKQLLEEAKKQTKAMEKGLAIEIEEVTL